MDNQSQARSLMQILIGVAWLDGKIQPEERQYLAKVAQAHQLIGTDVTADPDLEALLAGTISITPADCEEWIQAYLGDRSIYDDDRLIEAISGLIYSDGDVAVAEAKLLTNIQSEPSSDLPNSQPLLAKVQQLYQNWRNKSDK
ncbi:TerB family tellurite resistance protein [Chamaesiphon sp. VAR_48_metabat_403]|uniref:tellurite resistance TerB family protein n=1 Tax=Chamaesiphon sp. VAR_48_metabat_403 TaxID=2964700 RepID=UPI00286DD624|nr:TerB family tellurite resistance protein [Chamaesiphon sp. VAR_48_metabat_403]